MLTLLPTLSDMTVNIVRMDSRMLPPVNSRAPEKMPMIRDMYTSFVQRASTIVMIGGRTDQAVAAIIIPTFLYMVCLLIQTYSITRLS